jgi:cytochrome c556
MVAAYAEIIVRPGMENADDEKFRGFARTLQQSAIDLRQAVRNENYDASKTAAGVMAKTCTACHAEYR